MWYIHTEGYYSVIKRNEGDFPGGPVVKNLPSNAGDVGSIPGWLTKIPTCRWATKPTGTTKDPACRNKESACCD